MQFLKTVLWVLVAVLAALFARANWNPVTLNLWGDIQADIKIPLLMLITFLIGFLPTWLITRARMWTMRRRLEALDRQRVSAGPAGAPAEEESEGLGI